MAWGVIINNQNGRRMIDSFTASMALRHKVSVTSVFQATTGVQYGSVFKFTVTAKRPFVAWGAPHQCTLMQRGRSGDQWSFTIWTPTDAGAVNTFYVFDDASEFLGALSGFGLSVLAPGGRRLWSLGAKSMVVMPAEGNWPSGRTYATSMLGNGGTSSASGSRRQVYMLVAGVNGNQLVAGSGHYSTTTDLEQPYGAKSFGRVRGYVTVDVTSY